MVVVFRYDDYHASLGAETRAKEEIERRFLDAFASQGVPLTLGVVPNYEGRALLADDSAARERLRRLLADAPFEAALHGLTHQSFAPQGARNSEFAGRPRAEQAERLSKGKALLEEWLDARVATFIPPWNTFDEATVGALAETGFTTLSAALSEPAVAAPIVALPHTCGLREVRRTVARLARRGGLAFVVCTFHHFSFTESPDPLARHYAQCSLGELERLLGWCRGQAGVELATLGDAAAAWGSVLGDGRVDEARARWTLAFAWRRRRLVGRLAIRLWAPRAILDPGAYARGNAWLRRLIGRGAAGGGP